MRIDADANGCTAFNNNAYVAPDHVPTIAPVTQEVPGPVKDFCLNVEIPPTSKDMKNLYDLKVVFELCQ